ncbi:MAG: hypothetical protein P8Y97_16610 [Candidatus Lokiarchaeota archaeon]
MKLKLMPCILVFFILILPVSLVAYQTDANIQKNTIQVSNGLKTSDVVVHDMVHIFEKGEYTFHLDNLFFEKPYMYYIKIEIVTPHSSQLNITLKDPNSNPFNIFSYFPKAYTEYTIPFGVAIQGIHKLTFYSQANYTYNLHIKILKDEKCLYPLLTTEEITNLKHYEVVRFANEYNYSFDRNLEEGYSYRVVFERVNAISVTLSNEVRMSLSMSFGNNTSYTIYNNITLAEIDSLTSFKFGAATSSLYKFKIHIEARDPNVPYINLAFAVIWDHKVSDLINSTENNPIDTNSTTPDNNTLPDNNKTLQNPVFSIPGETCWIVAGIFGLGAILVIVFIATYRQKN